ncbi:MAG: hypothetical protein H0V12_05730 [Chloroflexi bacterium]|nr:hypothetical protein [Chloroflexota bacterium]
MLGVGLVLSALAIPLLAHAAMDRRVLRAAFRFQQGLPLTGPSQELLQKKLYDCGPAALAEALRLRGVVVSSEEIERLAGTTVRGTSMLGLQRAAAAVGVRADGMMLGFDDLHRVPLPVLVFVRGRHFVLVTAVDGYVVSVHDPAIGRVQFGRAQFLRDWHGEALVLQGGSTL